MTPLKHYQTRHSHSPFLLDHFISLGLFVFIALGFCIGTEMKTWAAEAPPKSKTSSASQKQERYENLELFQKVLHIIETNYVDEVKNKDLIYGAIRGMMDTLDPHSSFMPPDVFKEQNNETKGKFGGIGIEIGMKDNILTVVGPYEDTPAWKAGIKPNDRIVKINGESTKGMSIQDAVNKMRGKQGTDINISIYREGFDKIKDLTLTRDVIKIRAVRSESLEPGYAYIRLTTFNEYTSSDLKTALEKLEAKGKLKGIVLDLRVNPGGLLDQAVEVASQFLDEGVIVSTIGRNRDEKQVKHARKGKARKDLDLAVLVNSSTASAAEIVAGAFQDYKRALILGQPTFGKGSVQSVIELGADLGMKLTVARYYTPSGKSIQEKGVIPDILLDEYDPKLLAEAKRKVEMYREKDLKGHMVNVDEDPTSREFKKEELDALGQKGKDLKSVRTQNRDGAKDSKDSNDDEEMIPLRISPKDDYQVREALNYLKSFEFFKSRNPSST